MKKNLLFFAAMSCSLFTTMDVHTQAQNTRAVGDPALNAGQSTGGTVNQPSATRQGSKDYAPQRQEFRKKMLQMFDANHDGKIDDNERLKMRQKRREHLTSDPELIKANEEHRQEIQKNENDKSPAVLKK